LLGLRLEPLPRGSFLARPPPTRRLLAKLSGLVEELVALAEQPVDHRERRGDLPREVGFLFLGELFLVDVTTSLTEMSCAELLAQLAEALEREVGAEDGRGDLVLAFLDRFARAISPSRVRAQRVPSRAGRAGRDLRFARPAPA